jgi:hypothetical protein
VQVARSPLDERTRDRNWAFRDYFHGQGRDLSPDETRARPPTPIRQPYRSIVFQSEATGTLMAAFSVPIWDVAAPRAGQKEPIGVLAMTATLGHFGEVKGTRDQFAVLVDTRPSASGERGVIVEHPGLRKQTGTQLFSLDVDFLERAARLQERKLQAVKQTMQDRTAARTPASSQDDGSYRGDYRDPLGGEYAGRWLASLEPVFITRGQGEIYDTGWIVVVQELAQDTIQPVQALTGKLVRGGLVALAIVVAVVTSLWGAVMFLLDEPTRSRASAFWRRLGLPGSSTGTSRSSPPLARPALPAQAPADRTVQMDVRNPRERAAPQQDTQTG